MDMNLWDSIQPVIDDKTVSYIRELYSCQGTFKKRKNKGGRHTIIFSRMLWKTLSTEQGR